MDVEIENDPQAGRYELRVRGELASAVSYVRSGDQIVFPHTETQPAFRGQGLAERVVRRALDDARDDGLQVVPRCWFVAQFIDDHPDYADLLGGAGGDRTHDPGIMSPLL